MTVSIDRLVVAAIAGDLTRISKALRSSRQLVHERDSNGLTLLHHASFACQVDIVVALLNAGADPNARGSEGYCPIHFAAQQYCTEAMGLLLDHGADIEAVTDTGLTALHIAAFFAGRHDRADETVRFLLQHGAQIDLNSAVMLGRLARVREILREDPDAIHNCRVAGRLIFDAVELRRPNEVIRQLIEAGADLNSRGPEGATALHRATELGKSGVIKLLLDSGADPNLRTEAGETPLSLAISAGDTPTARSIVNLLLRRAATLDLNSALRLGRTSDALKMLEQNPNAVSEAVAQNNLLRDAILHTGSSEVIHRLLDCGVDINQPDSGGYYPLIRAIEHDPQLAILLLDRGAQTDIASPTGESLEVLIQQRPRQDRRRYRELLHRLRPDSQSDG